MMVTPNPAPVQRPPQLNGAIRFQYLLMQPLLHREEPLLLCCAGTHRPIPPDIAASATGGQRRAQVRAPVSALLRVDKRVSHGTPS